MSVEQLGRFDQLYFDTFKSHKAFPPLSGFPPPLSKLCKKGNDVENVQE